MINIAAVDISALDEPGYRILYHRASADRRKKADRYLRKEDSYRCIAADGLLRYALKQASDISCPQILRTPKGKPFLRGQDSFHFNISHSGRWVVIAWGDRPVGIDVEMMDFDAGKEQLACRFFHTDEQSYVFAAQAQEQSKRFYEIWTKKESYLKYLGTGIDCALNSFSVLQPMDTVFDSRSLEDAVLTVCSQEPPCQFIPVTVEQLLSV